MKVDELRKDIMRVACKNNMGHIAPSLSCLDILVALYYEPEFKNDIVILSKGHGCYGVYAIQADKGEIEYDDWQNFNLSGCLDGFGSLGHGLPIATGLAFGFTKQNIKKHIFCLVGDGELQEGSNWEAMSFIKHHKLKNISIIVDNNGLQAMDRVENILSANLLERFLGWGFNPVVCNGHETSELKYQLSKKPLVLIANTVKGNGIKCMENDPKFHFRVPNGNER